MGISLLRGLVDLGSAGIAQPDLARHLVKGLSGRVILGPSQDLIFTVVPDQDQMGVAAGDNEAGKGRFQRRLRDIVGADMSLDVVDTDQGDPGRKAQSLGGGDTDQEGADQAGPVGDGDGVHLLQLFPSLLQGLADHLRDALGVFSGGDLGHHAPVEGVDIDLGGDHIGQDRAAVDNDGGGCLVTAGFDREDLHIFFFYVMIHHFYCFPCARAACKTGLRGTAVMIRDRGSCLSHVNYT